MDDPGAMRLVERIKDLNGVGEYLACRQSTSAGGVNASQAVRERLPFEMLEHEEVHAVLPADVEQRADVWVIQRGDRARLAIEPLTQLSIGGECFGQHLDRDGAIEPRVARAVNLPHAAAANQRQNFVSAEARTWGDGQ